MNTFRFPTLLVLALSAGFLCTRPLLGAQKAPSDETKETQAEKKGRKAYNISFYHAHLTDVNFINIDLTDANFSKAHLTRVNLSNINLTRANLTAARLRLVNLNGAILTDADLALADLAEVDLTAAADLSGANLYGVKGLSNEQLEQALARGAILRLPANMRWVLRECLKNLYS
jgi:uncharacterized protein YjbI with pentapeptide repeats